MRLSERGFTLAETMLSMAVTAILMAMVIPIFEASNRGFSSSELHNKLKESNQSIVNHISHNLVQCKRIFENIPNDLVFSTRTGVAAYPGRLLPSKMENGNLSPKTFLERAQVGNSLFIARFDVPIDLVVTATTSVTAPNGFPEPIRLDTYRFNYYYLKPLQPEMNLGDNPVLDLWEWESIAYVDCGQIMTIQNFTKSSTTVAALRAGGFQYAWLSSATTASSAFYNLLPNGTLSRGDFPNPPHMILESHNKSLLKQVSGMTGTHPYGVSPNTGALDTPNPVPVFANAAGNFPGGFEVQVAGNAMARQVHLRMVLTGRGYKGQFLSRQESSLTSARDLW